MFNLIDVDDDGNDEREFFFFVIERSMSKLDVSKGGELPCVRTLFSLYSRFFHIDFFPFAHCQR